MKNHVFILGDTHGEWNLLTKKLLILEKHKEVKNSIKLNEPYKIQVIQLGDFGYFPHIPKYWLGNEDFLRLNRLLKDKNITLRFLEGNHDNHEVLNHYVQEYGYKKAIKIPETNIKYQPFGSTLHINGKTLLFCGGAESVDRLHRTPLYDWWPDEIITEEKMSRLPDVKVHTILSHTNPYLLEPTIKERKYTHYNVYSKHNTEYKSDDFSRRQLDKVFEKYKPKNWYTAHYHFYLTSTVRRCKFYMLDMLDEIPYHKSMLYLKY